MSLELWDHQKKAIELGRIKPNLALFMDAGTGKTAALIHILRDDYNSKKRISKTLIFAPLSVCAQWKREFQKFSAIPEEKILVLTGGGGTRATELTRAMAMNRDVIAITNYEGVQIRAFYDALLLWGPEIVIMDEAHRLKDSSSVRAKKIYPICSGARRKFILTGTPILNSMLDIYGQYKAFEPSYFGPSFWQFRQKYFYDKNQYMPSHVKFPDWQPKPQAAKLLGEIVAKTSVQAKKSECLDLPPLLSIPVPVALGHAQAKSYLQMEKDFVTELNETVVAAEFAMTKGLRLRQILAGYLSHDSESEAQWYSDVPRLDALKDLLESLGGQKTIIWTNFKPTYSKLSEICTKLNLDSTFLTGEQTIRQKEAAIEDFCRGSAQVLISNPAAGGVGVNLTEAPISIYYTTGYSLEQFLQSQARNFRAGSEMHEKVTHYYFQSPGTIDEVIYDALTNKQSVGEAVLKWAKKKLTLDNAKSNSYSDKQRSTELCL